MNEKNSEYEANYKSALSFLKIGIKGQALDCLDRAYAQVPDEEKTGSNAAYLDILDNLAMLSLERGEKEKAVKLIDEGLSVKNNHADLLFMKSLLLLDEHKYDQVLDSLINYFLSLDKDEAGSYNYKYVHEGVLQDIYNKYLPRAYRNAFEYERIRDIAVRLSKAAHNQWLVKACELMADIDKNRNCREN